jgi:hypothetical protein
MDQNQQMPMDGVNEPSLATMSTAGPSIDKTAPMGPDGDDSQLDGIQNSQDRGNQGFMTNPPSKFMGGADGQFGNGNDNEQDPDLTIDDNDDEYQNKKFNLKDQDELENGDSQVPNDDEFSDDDAYNVNPEDFQHDHDSNGFDDGSEPDEDSKDNKFGKKDKDSDEDPDLEISDKDSEEDDSKDKDKKDNKDEEQKPFPGRDKKKFVEESLKPTDYSRKTRKESKKKERVLGKKETKVNEGEDGEIDDGITFGESFDFAMDNSEDEAFLTEANMMAQLDPSLAPKVRLARRELNKVRNLRDAASTHIKNQLKLVKNPEDRQQLAQVHAKNREHFRSMAQAIKTIHTGKSSSKPEMDNEKSINEMVQHTVNHPNGRTKVHITANKEEGPFSSRLYVNGGETATNTTAKHTTLKGAKKWADKVMKKHLGVE